MRNSHIAPSAECRDSADIGQFTVVEDHARLDDDVKVDHHCVIQCESFVGARTQIGSFTSVGEGAHIGSGCRIGSHVTLHPHTRLGDDVRVDDGAVIGKQPMQAPNSAATRNTPMEPVVVGNQCILGAGVILYAGCILDDNVLVADLASIREEVTIGAFTIVGRGVSIENQCSIGRYCKLETNAYISAYSVLEDRVFVAPGVLTSNDNFIGRTEERFKHFRGVTVRKGGRLAVGAVVLPGLEVGPDAVLAAGAVLTRNADPRVIFAGVPAQPFRDVPTEQLLENQNWKEET